MSRPVKIFAATIRIKELKPNAAFKTKDDNILKVRNWKKFVDR